MGGEKKKRPRNGPVDGVQTVEEGCYCIRQERGKNKGPPSRPLTAFISRGGTEHRRPCFLSRQPVACLYILFQASSNTLAASGALVGEWEQLRRCGPLIAGVA